MSTVESRIAGAASRSGMLPPREQFLAMPAQDLRDVRARIGTRAESGVVVSRAVLFLATVLLTTGFAYELYAVLAAVRITPFQIVFLVLCTLAFGWVALGSLTTAMGFLPLFAGERADPIVLPFAGGVPTQRTALLFPVYHENPAIVAGTIEAIVAELDALDRTRAFDVFILSDTRGDAAGQAEEAVYAALARRLRSVLPVYYRRRPENTERKAGNIKEWVERFGGGYGAFVILDADSILSGELLVRLALAMQAHPAVGLIQTVPRLTGGTTLFQCLLQFATDVYGPASAAGLAAWHGTQGNYWGHNAIVRTIAFAAAAGLPVLPGRPPFGGHIQSHDFVEAALLQRAGWQVAMVPTAAGSYEGSPPGLIDYVGRDRRWAQGNLQHVPMLAASGLTAMSRIHLAMGAASYIVPAIWAASLAVGIVLALQGEHLIPSYFQDSRTLFPIWPIIDPGDAFRLFLATMTVVM
ncbi:MAG: glucans biosynthesis glucosyltransferase MdoH, partial [Hyphomicrobiaceae bacterium]